MGVRDIASEIFKRGKSVVKDKAQDVKGFLTGAKEELPIVINEQQTPVETTNPKVSIKDIGLYAVGGPIILTSIIKDAVAGSKKQIADSAIEKVKAPVDFIQYYGGQISNVAKQWWNRDLPNQILNENIIDDIGVNDLKYIEQLYADLEPVKKAGGKNFMNYLTKEGKDYINALPEDIKNAVINSKTVEDLQKELYNNNFLSLPKNEQAKKINKYNGLVESIASFDDRMKNNMFYKKEITTQKNMLASMSENDINKLTSIDFYSKDLEDIASKDKRYNPKDPTQTQDITQASLKVIENINREGSELLKSTYNEDIKDDNKLGTYRQTYLSDVDNYKDTYIKAVKRYVENVGGNMKDFSKNFQSTAGRKAYPVLQELANSQARLKTSEFLIRNRLSDLTIKEGIVNIRPHQLLQGFFGKVLGGLGMTLDSASGGLRVAMGDEFNLLDVSDFNTLSQTQSGMGKFLAKVKNFYYNHQADVLLLATPTKVPGAAWLSRLPGAARVAEFMEGSRLIKAGMTSTKRLAREAKIDSVFDYYTDPYVGKELANANLGINLFAEGLIKVASEGWRAGTNFIDSKRLEEFSKNYIKEVNVPIQNADGTVSWTTKEVRMSDILQPGGLKETDDAFASVMKNMSDAETTNYVKYVNTIAEMKKEFDAIANKPTSQRSKTERQFIMSNMDALQQAFIKGADGDTTLINTIKQSFEDYKRVLGRSGGTSAGKRVVEGLAKNMSQAAQIYLKDVDGLTKTIVAEAKATGKVSVKNLEKLGGLIKNRTKEIVNNFVSNLSREKYFGNTNIENIVNKVKESGKLTEKDVLDIVNNLTDEGITFSDFSKRLETMVGFVPNTFKGYKKLFDISQQIKFLNEKFAKYLKNNKILFSDIAGGQLGQFDKGTLKLAYIANRYKNADDFITVVLHEISHSFRHYLPKEIIQKVIKEFDGGKEGFLKILKERFDINSIKELQSSKIKNKFSGNELYQALYNESRIYENVQEYFAYNLERALAGAMRLDTMEGKLFQGMSDMVKELINTVRPDIGEGVIYEVAENFITNKYKDKLFRGRGEGGQTVDTFRRGVDEDTLIAEARKYKSAEEFIDAQVKNDREILYTKVHGENVEVIKNPKSSDYRQLDKEYRAEYPGRAESGRDPTTRSTYDENGNKYLWRSDKSLHPNIEKFIKEKFGLDAEQNRMYVFDWKFKQIREEANKGGQTVDTFRKKLMEVQERTYKTVNDWVKSLDRVKADAAKIIFDTTKNKGSRGTFLENIVNFIDGNLSTLKQFIAFSDDYTKFSKPLQEIIDNRDNITQGMNPAVKNELEASIHKAIGNSMFWGLKGDDGVVAGLLYEAIVGLGIKKLGSEGTELLLRNKLLGFALQLYKGNDLGKNLLKFLSSNIGNKKELHKIYVDYMKQLLETKPQYLKQVLSAGGNFKENIENLAVMMKGKMSQQALSSNELTSTFVSTINLLGIDIKGNGKVLADNLTKIIKFMDTQKIIRDYPVIEAISQINKYSIKNPSKYSKLEKAFISGKSIDDVIKLGLEDGIIQLEKEGVGGFEMFGASIPKGIKKDDKMFLYIGGIARDFYKNEKIANNMLDYLIGNIKNIDAKTINKYKKMLANEIASMNKKEARLGAIVGDHNVVGLDIGGEKMSKYIEEFDTGDGKRYKYRNINGDVFYVDTKKNIYAYNGENQAQTLQNKNIWTASDSSAVGFFNIYNGYSIKLKETRKAMTDFVSEWRECFKK